MTPPRRTANRYPHLTAQLRQIIGAYAMRDATGRTVLCAPRDVELRFYPHPGKPGWTGNNGKVCYPNQLAGDAAAKAINHLEGADPVQPYECPRGGHYHHVDMGRARRVARNIIVDIHAAARRAAWRAP